jgi:hypothetical protein
MGEPLKGFEADGCFEEIVRHKTTPLYDWLCLADQAIQSGMDLSVK